MDLKIKPEFADVIIGFRNSGIPLGKRSQEDLQFLAGKVRANPKYAKYFEALPSDKDLLDAKGDAFLAKNPAVKSSQKSDG
jgi:hypothetical protein